MGDGICPVEVMASTAAGPHAAVMLDVQQVLDWAWSRFPDSHGPIDDGIDWDHEFQVTVEDGARHTVTLTLTGSGRFVDEFRVVFGCVDA